MLLRSALFGLVAVVSFASVGCGSDAADPPPPNNEDDVKVDTRTAAARAQYDANVAFANAYVARCKKPTSNKPRVLVTGFGRFMDIANNATGRIVSTLVPAAAYPETQPPPSGQVDSPEPQLSVGQATQTWPQSGDVEICAMILPVYWDLASILMSKEMDVFKPNVVMMNGVAGSRQDIWLELGATNRAAKLDDGSDQLMPFASSKSDFAKIVDGGEDARPNLLSWDAVQAAAAAAVARHAAEVDSEVKLADILPGVKRAGFPRSSNTYLCNNITYVTGWLMSHPGKTTKLLTASPPVSGKINEVKVKLATDLTHVPRVFVHWPSELDTKHHAAGADIMRSILDAQVHALAKGDAPKDGDNKTADPSLQGGDTF